VHHLVKARLVQSCAAVPVMYLTRSVDGDTYEEMIVSEEAARFGGKQGAIGLDGILYMATAP